jgi:purine-binding chemotaxis protein CheW
MAEALEMEITAEDVMRGKYLTFLVGDGDFGVEISYVTEIIGIQDITGVPSTQSYVKGIINLRGTIVPVIDVRLRFGQSETEYTEKTCIIVVSMDEMSIGLLVDQVQDVLTIDDANIQPPPSNTENVSNFFIKAIGRSQGKVEQLIDLNKIFEIEEA